MSEGEILLSERRGAVLWLTLNRPKVHNAMNSALVSATHAAIRAASDDEAVRVIVLQGAGTRAFTAGADIGEIAAAGPAEMRAYNRRWLDLFRAIELCPKPVIASVRGWATGGGTETSLACDFVIALSLQTPFMARSQSFLASCPLRACGLCVDRSNSLVLNCRAN